MARLRGCRVAKILQGVETSKRALDEQYEFLLGDLTDQPRAVETATAAT